MAGPIPPVPAGISSNAVRNIPQEWSAQWFRRFITDHLKNADFRNAIQGSGITITGTEQQQGTISATGGGAPEPWNVTIDTHTATEAFSANDEFEGTILDTTGTRFAGATPWTWYQQQGSSSALVDGSLLLTAAVGLDVGSHFPFIAQPLPVVSNSATFTYIAKLSNQWFGTTDNTNGGNQNIGSMILADGSYNGLIAGFWTNGPSWAPNLIVLELATGVSTVVLYSNGISNTFAPFAGMATQWLYFMFQCVSGACSIQISQTGMPNSFTPIFSFNLSTYFASGPSLIGLSTFSHPTDATESNILYCDWFRRYV